MGRRLSLVGLKMRHTRWVYKKHGLESKEIELENGAIIHCWVPSTTGEEEEGSETEKPSLVLLHGFGGNATMAWERQVGELSKHFRLYMPDLLFFGASRMKDTKNKEEGWEEERTEVFQARCVHDAVRKAGLKGKAMVAGHSYGGFVAYRLAHLYGTSFADKVVIISSGVMMDSRSNDAVLEESGSRSIHQILVPATPAELKLGLKFVVHLPAWLPNFFYADMFQALSGDRQARIELVDGIILGKENSPPLPKLEQKVLILWGEDDKIFDVKLAHKLNEFLGDNSQLALLKGAGHLPTLTKAKECNKILISFLTNNS